MGNKKYGWAANKIDDEDMKKLYQMKEETNKRITDMVKDAVKEYIARKHSKI